MKLLSWITSINSDPQTTPEEAKAAAPVLIQRLEELKDTAVKTVMIPRALVVALDADVQLKRVRRLKSARVPYFPVYQGDLDHILGWIPKQRVLEMLNEPSEEVRLAENVRVAGQVEENTPVSQLADVFLATQSPFLVVKNAQGNTTGIMPLSEFVELVFGFEMALPAQATSAEATAPLLRSYEI